MDFDRLIEQLQHQAGLLADSARHAELSAPVPSCPGWTVADVLGHTTTVHRRVTWIVHGHDRADFRYQPPEPALLLAEFSAGATALADALRQAPADLAVPTLWPSQSPRLFWARRQAHETAIHAVDVQLAAGYGVAELDPDFAADGVDELVMNIAAAQFDRAALDRAYTIALTPLDANVAWTIRIAPAAVSAHRSADDGADLNAFGLASALYRWVWNRADDLDVSLRGELALADRWHQACRVTGRPPG